MIKDVFFQNAHVQCAKKCEPPERPFLASLSPPFLHPTRRILIAAAAAEHRTNAPVEEGSSYTRYFIARLLPARQRFDSIWFGRFGWVAL